MNSDPVLVLTEECDPTSDLVVDELNRRRVPVFRCDPGDFPEELKMSAWLGDDGWLGILRTPHRAADIATFRSAYYRRPTTFRFPADMSEPERKWASTEARAGFGGLLVSLSGWLNHPLRIAYADYKPVQLRSAQRCGLRTPRTLLTNEPESATEFVRQVERVVYKPLWGTDISEADEHRLIYTSLLECDNFDAAGTDLTAHLFQEWVPKDHEIRLTAVDDQFFAVAIDALSTAAHTDWRSDYANLAYARVETPDDVRAGVSAMLDQFGLRFGAFDFVVSPDGRWVFLEINPNGQWAWLETQAGAPIAAAIADSLQKGQL